MFCVEAEKRGDCVYSNDLDESVLHCFVFTLLCCWNIQVFHKAINRHSKIIHKLQRNVADVILRNIFSQHSHIQSGKAGVYRHKKSQLN